jgi:hypothetical protein
VSGAEPQRAKEVSGPARVLVIAPTEPHAPEELKRALRESLASGAMEWLEPISGAQARQPYLFERLRRGPAPHVVHFIGHGALRGERTPVLRLGDQANGEPSWMDAEILAQELRANGQDELRLVVLEACEGARPGPEEEAFSGGVASAAELFARAGAGAAIAHLWPVKADVARAAAADFYRALTGPGARRGDAAVSLNQARRTALTLFGGSAEAFSPVLYLRGSDPRVLGVAEPQPIPTPTPIPTPRKPSKPALRKLLELVLVADSDLDAFASDYFPAASRRFTDGMDRVRKTTILMERADPSLLVDKLREHDPEAFAQHEHVLA